MGYVCVGCFFFKQKTAYEMRISDWSSDVCSSDLTQALVRLPMMQRQRDLAAGLDTAAYVTGYRGSPLGAVDQQMARARQFLEKHHIRFQAGVNEDFAATAIRGPQQLDLFGYSHYAGVFALCYATDPGVDRRGAVLRPGHISGPSNTSPVLHKT